MPVLPERVIGLFRGWMVPMILFETTIPLQYSHDACAEPERHLLPMHLLTSESNERK
jgi:hypothetical protein